METFPESTSQGFPSEGNLGPFPSFGNVGVPYMVTLSLPRLAIGLPVWFFFTLVIPSVPSPAPPSPSFEPHHDDSKVDPSPSSPISSPSSSTSLGESFKSSNQEEAKEKNKKIKKKELAKKEVDCAAITSNTPPIGKPFVPP